MLKDILADVAKLVDAPGLGPGGVIRGGSSPSIRTKSLGIAQAGRVLHLECRGHWFKSSYPDQIYRIGAPTLECWAGLQNQWLLVLVGSNPTTFANFYLLY